MGASLLALAKSIYYVCTHVNFVCTYKKKYNADLAKLSCFIYASKLYVRSHGKIKRQRRSTLNYKIEETIRTNTQSNEI